MAYREPRDHAAHGVSHYSRKPASHQEHPGLPTRDSSEHHLDVGIGGGGAPAYAGSHLASAAPPGVGGGGGGGPAHEGGAPDPSNPLGLTWRPGCGRKPRTGDVVPSDDGSRTVRLAQSRPTGKLDKAPLSLAEARAIARRLERHPGTAGARSIIGRADSETVRPKHPADRTRAVARLTGRTIGRQCGILVVVAGLRRWRLWGKVAKVGRAARRAEQRRKARETFAA